MKPLSILAAATLVLISFRLSAQHVIEAGTGWQNTGATRELTWRPALQGSRKDVPAFIGWRYVGEKRVYYSPTARFVYLNTWSIGGAMNLINAAVSPAGIGIYFTKPPAAYKPEERIGKWFISANINAAFRFGVNVTPHKPKSDKVPDPEDYKENLQWRLDHQDSLGITLFDFEQHYPFGPYGYIALDLPVQLNFTTVLKQGHTIGFFLESSTAIFEWSMDGKGYPYAYGYSMVAGINFMFVKPAKT